MPRQGCLEIHGQLSALDTCVLLDVVRAAVRSQMDVIAQTRALSEKVTLDPGRVQLVVTSLVVVEWNQNKDQVRQEMTTWLSDCTFRDSLHSHAAKLSSRSATA